VRDEKEREIMSETIEGIIFESKVIIREKHLDLFGHVNNATYLELFEEARWDIVHPRGFGLDRVQETMIGPTILDIHLQFRREIRNREEITIRTFVTGFTKKTHTLRQLMINGKGEEACVADFVMGLFDMRARKLIEPTPEWRQAIGIA
jgi:thioesterase III